MTVVTIEQQIQDLGPWCHEIEVGEVTTAVADKDPNVAFLDPRTTAVAKSTAWLFKDGMQGRSVLDCACNGGGYTFHARELGAGKCFGFDVRQHWIDQARFIRDFRGYEDMDFQVCDLYNLDTEPADVTFFNGLLYHLPDPIRGLKIAADLTNELMFVDTAIRLGQPDGYLAVENENPDLLLSGVHGLNWLPTGPDVLSRMLRWVGFEEWRLIGQIELREDVGRIAMVATKTQGMLAELTKG